MAVRQIRVIGDEILNKKCKPVKEMTDRTKELIEDMFETMYEANGVGLAAPQVGILKSDRCYRCRRRLSVCSDQPGDHRTGWGADRL